MPHPTPAHRHRRTRARKVTAGPTDVPGTAPGPSVRTVSRTVRLLELPRIRPTTLRVHTWNASENEHMLAINTTLGFTLRALSGEWQLRL